MTQRFCVGCTLPPCRPGREWPLRGGAAAPRRSDLPAISFDPFPCAIACIASLRPIRTLYEGSLSWNHFRVWQTGFQFGIQSDNQGHDRSSANTSMAWPGMLCGEAIASGDKAKRVIRLDARDDQGITWRRLRLTPPTRITWRWRVTAQPSAVAEDSLHTHDYISVAPSSRRSRCTMNRAACDVSQRAQRPANLLLPAPTVAAGETRAPVG